MFPGHGIPVNSVSTVALYGNVLYGGNDCLQSGRLSERATSKLALNVLGMSTLRLIAESLHRVGFAETRR